MSPRFAIAVHGGAGKWPEEEMPAALEGVATAARKGAEMLAAGGCSLEAVIAAVVALEDDPHFNAGTGSALNLDGEAEMDASVMAGDALRCGAVCGIRRIKNPVLVARRLMEDTDHVLLCGAGAERFARAAGFADYDPVTPARREDYEKKLAALRGDGSSPFPRLREIFQRYPGLAPGTVGAVALDVRGRLAAATSTGGVTLKLPGRVGDSPLPGAGNYASRTAASSATGHGEFMMRALATRAVCDLIAAGVAPQQAIEQALAEVNALGGDGGIIAVDQGARLGVAHTTSAMPHALFASGMPEVIARFKN